MKKILYVFAAAGITSLAACSAHNTAGDTKDSSASHGYSGPQSSAADTINGSAAPFAESTSGTDTSTDGHGVDDPTVDTIYSKKKAK